VNGKKEKISLNYALVWFRRDLRIRDNLALFYAMQKNEVTGLFILDHEASKKHGVAQRQQDFIRQGMELLKTDLKKLSIDFIIIDTHKTSDIPTLILEATKKTKSKTLFYNIEYEVNEQARDKAVTVLLEKNNISVTSYHDQTMYAPGTIKTGQDGMFKVFTAFKNAWLKHFENNPFKILGNHVSETEAYHRLNYFIEHHLSTYDRDRDFPALNHTSKLSPYLATGMISLRECFLAAYPYKNKGAETWRNELIWREFYKHILALTPRVSMHKPFQMITEKIKWVHDEVKLHAWKTGNTGFPIIDAAMRQLNQTGWMHNRLRMIVAMFFTKNLWFDWRVGEAYFMSQLIDGDLAANNGGWQWCASTGTDAVPYFRIFNPITQSERFDPNGEFIKIYCPELEDFDKKSIHSPHERAPSLAEAMKYPKPIVDLKTTRKVAINKFSELMLK